MAITFVGASSAAADNAVQTLSPAKPPGTASGDVLVVFVVGVQNNDDVAAPSGWTQITKYDGGTGVTCWAWYKVAASEPASYTFSYSRGGSNYAQNDWAISMMSFRGVDNAAPMRISANATGGNTTSVTSAALAGQAATDMVVVFGGARPDSSGVATVSGPTGSGYVSPAAALATCTDGFGAGVDGSYCINGPQAAVTASKSSEMGVTSLALIEGAGGGDGGGGTAPGPTPTWVAAGAFGHAGTAGGMSPGLPAGWQQDDVFLMFVETMNGVGAASPADWTELPSSPQYANTGLNSSRTALNGYWRRATASESAPVFGDTGNHAAGTIHAFRGCDISGNPWDDTAGVNETTSDTSGSAPSVTTADVNRLVVVAGCWGTNTGSAQISSGSNANLTGVTERSDDSTLDGNGGGVAVYTGEKATAGATGVTTLTYASSAAKGLITVALRPPLVSTGGVGPSVGILFG